MNRASTFIAADQNPFATEWIDAIPYRFVEGDWNTHLRHLQQLDFCGAIVGRKGAGKTTLLENLARQLEADRSCLYHCFDRDPDRHAREIPKLVGKKGQGVILLVDGLERVSWSPRRRLLKSCQQAAGGLVVAVHRPCKLPTWIECCPDLSTLRHVIEHLGFDTNSAVWHQAESVLWQFDGNVREVLRWLYDRVAAGYLPLDTRKPI